MTGELLPWISVVASTVIAAATVAALAWGVWTYWRSSDVQTQLAALGMLQHYLDLAVAHPHLASRDEGHPVDVRYAWFAVQALATAQTLWLLVGRQPAWQRTIDALIRQHRGYLRSGAFVCDDFSPDFVAYLGTRVAGAEWTSTIMPADPVP